MTKTIERETVQRMKDSGALLQGHFLLSSAMHSEFYLQCALFLRFPDNAAWAGTLIGEKISRFSPALIISPSVGGLIIGHEVARYLGVPFIFCEREKGTMKLRRFPAPEGLPYFIIEDVVTTGRSTMEVKAAIDSVSECDFLGAACIVDRSGGEHEIRPLLYSLMSSDLPVYTHENCPLCAKGIPIEEPGSRRLSL